MTLRTLTSRLRSEDGQAVIEFALVLPLLVAFIMLIAGMGRLFNAYNDLNQMAADGARFAAVGNYPGNSALLATGDTPVSRAAAISVTGAVGGACVVGGTVRVTASKSVPLLPMPGIASIAPIAIAGRSEMRVERCP